MSLYPKNLKEYIAFAGIPRGYDSHIFIVDPVNGDDDNYGQSFDKPLATIAAAEDLCTGEKHDTVLFVPGDTSDSTAATITWDKDHTHLIGLGAPFGGIGCRCRIASTVAAPAFTLSARGCIFKGIQIQNSYAGASGGFLVSGPYNYFEGMYFNGMNVAGGAQASASYCLEVDAAENWFKNCTIGSVQVACTSTNAVLVLSTGAQTFEGCRIQHYSETAGNFLVRLAAGTSGMSLLTFKDCIFYNQSVNWAAGSTDVFNVAQTGSHYVLLKDCAAIGGTGTGMTWADDKTHVYVNGPNPGTGGGIVAQATS
jgi:hypothetical protein